MGRSRLFQGAPFVFTEVSDSTIKLNWNAFHLFRFQNIFFTRNRDSLTGSFTGFEDQESPVTSFELRLLRSDCGATKSWSTAKNVRGIPAVITAQNGTSTFIFEELELQVTGLHNSSLSRLLANAMGLYTLILLALSLKEVNYPLFWFSGLWGLCFGSYCSKRVHAINEGAVSGSSFGNHGIKSRGGHPWSERESAKRTLCQPPWSILMWVLAIDWFIFQRWKILKTSQARNTFNRFRCYMYQT